MKINIIRVFLILALIGTFSIIFGFSNQDSKKSSGISQKVTNFVIKFIPRIQKANEPEKQNMIDRTEKVIRKIAHFSIYTLVGLLLMGLMCTFNMKQVNKLSISLIIGVIYAITDEIHQAFIPGRGPHITDVILDTMGVLTGIIIVMLVPEILSRIGRNKYKHIT